MVHQNSCPWQDLHILSHGGCPSHKRQSNRQATVGLKKGPLPSAQAAEWRPGRLPPHVTVEALPRAGNISAAVIAVGDWRSLTLECTRRRSERRCTNCLFPWRHCTMPCQEKAYVVSKSFVFLLHPEAFWPGLVLPSCRIYRCSACLRGPRSPVIAVDAMHEPVSRRTHPFTSELTFFCLWICFFFAL